MSEHAIRSLAAATTLQAVRDYFRPNTSEKKRNEVLSDLRSPWMDFFTNGTSVNVAEALEKHPEEIKARLRQQKEEV